jgi:succinate dehydrogenase hydrophobic anchor subunit
MNLTAFWVWLEATAVGQVVQGSLQLTAVLSAVHVAGMTLVGGSALVSSLRLLGALFPDAPARDVTRAARAGLLLGLALSVSTGVLLFSARATAAVENDFFRVKMLLLAGAILFHAGWCRRLLLADGPPSSRTRLGGAVSLALWMGVVAFACAYILLE